MAQKIDSSEGFVMADLEGMESKRLEQASKIAVEFEDRSVSSEGMIRRIEFKDISHKNTPFSFLLLF